LFLQSEFYLTLQAYNPNSGSLQAIFNTPDEDMHKRLKSPIASLFTPNNVPAYEGRVDEVLALLGARLDEQFLQHDRIFELGSWLQFFAFDVMGTLTFSKRYGFLETGKDVGRMLSTIKDFMRSSAPLTQIAWLDWLLRKNRVGDWLQRHFFTQASMGILGFVGKAIGEKRAALAAAEKANATAETTAAAHGGKLGRDFLTHYVELQQNDPQIPPWAPTAWTFSNVIAGSDSVGSLMRTTVFNLLAYPHTLERLYQELRDSVDTSSGSPFPAYATVRNLPYLDACVQEGIRMHPPFCLPFERVVPRGGVTVLGKFLPEGTVVGGSPYVVNRHRGTFGDDAEFWRPERWLEKGDEHKRKLEQSMLTVRLSCCSLFVLCAQADDILLSQFGSGRRVCLGRHVGIMEIKKLISFLVLNYDVSDSSLLLHPDTGATRRKASRLP
jgi:cytochrome P450